MIEIIQEKIPQSIDIETAVLGAILLEKDIIFQVEDIISEKSFFDQKNKEVYRSILDLRNKEKSIDLYLVQQDLKNKNKLDFVNSLYLAELTQGVNSSYHIREYVKILKEKEIARSLIFFSQKTYKNAKNEELDCFETLEEAEKELLSINNDLKANTIRSCADIITEYIEEQEKGDILKERIYSGYKDLDKLFGGFRKGNLIILAAAPGMGKSAFAGNLAINMLFSNKNVLFFSLEMSEQEIVNRILGILTDIHMYKIDNNILSNEEKEKIYRAEDLMKKNDRMFIEEGRIDLNGLKRKCRILKKQKKIDVIFLDYLQLVEVNSKKGTRENDISEISRTLKGIATELDVCFIALSQINRAVGTQENKRPELHSLRESGAIEQDANAVIFLYDETYYDKDNLIDKEIKTEIIVKKNRTGGKGTVFLDFKKNTSKFSDNKDF
jgi:replicative DNA helicase